MLPVPSLPPGRVLDTNACSFVPGNPLSPSLRLFLSPPPCLGAANALAIILRLLRVLCQKKAPRAPPCNRSYSNKHRRSNRSYRSKYRRSRISRAQCCPKTLRVFGIAREVGVEGSSEPERKRRPDAGGEGERGSSGRDTEVYQGTKPLVNTGVPSLGVCAAATRPGSVILCSHGMVYHDHDVCMYAIVCMYA